VTVAHRREQTRRQTPSIAEEKWEASSDPEEVEDDSLDLLLSAFGSRHNGARPSTSTTTTSSSSSTSTSTSTTTSSTKTLSASEIIAQADYLIAAVARIGLTGDRGVNPSEGGIRIADKVRIAASLRRYHNQLTGWAGANVCYYIVWSAAGKIDITGHRIVDGDDKSRGKSNVFNYHVQW